jgi:hypothetical protein
MSAAPKQTSPPACKSCGSASVLLGKLPSVGFHPAAQVFRCIACNWVAAVEVR